MHSQDLLSSYEEGDRGRRGFFKRSMMVAGGAMVGAALITSSERELHAQAPVSVGTQMKAVQRHENEHVATIITVINSLNGTPRQSPVFKNLQTTNIPQFLGLSRALENTGVGAYLGATPAISNPQLLSAAASIALVEARHAGFFNSITSRPVTENAFGQEQTFDRAFTIQEVVDAVTPYVADLNGPPLTFSLERSAPNDIAILNFALALEYLEAAYYNINVPRYYR